MIKILHGGVQLKDALRVEVQREDNIPDIVT
jgi:hypothetical protein